MGVQGKINIPEEFNIIFKISHDIQCLFTKDGSIIKSNAHYQSILADTDFYCNDNCFLKHIHADDVLSVRTILSNLKTGCSQQFNCRVQSASGKIKWLSWTVSPVDSGELIYGSAKCLEEFYNVQLSKTLQLESDILCKSISNHLSLQQIISELICGLEKIYDGMMGAVFLFHQESRQLRFLSAPSLPNEYASTINNLEIGPETGSCWAAIYYKNPVLVDDISTHPLWKNFRILASKHGLVSCWSFPIMNADGKALGSFSIYHQTSKLPTAAEMNMLQRFNAFLQLLIENHQSREEIKIHNERFKYASMATNDAVWDLDLLESTLVWSNNFELLFGHTPEKSTANFNIWSSLIHPSDRQGVVNSIEEVIQNPTVIHWEKEYRFLKSNHQYAHVLDRGYVIRNENKKAVRMVGAMRDVSDRKQYLGELKKSKENYEVLFFNNPLPMFSYNIETLDILMVNNAALNLYGYNRNEFIKLTLKDLRPKSEWAKLQQSINGIDFYNQLKYTGLRVHQKKDKTVFDVEIASHYIDQDGTKTRLVTVTDVSEKVQAKKEILSQNKRLKEIAHITSHEIRKPLSSILGLIQLIETHDQTDENLAEIISYLKESSLELDEVIRSIINNT